MESYCEIAIYNGSGSLAFRPRIWVVVVNKVHNLRNSTEIFYYLPLIENKGIKSGSQNITLF